MKPMFHVAAGAVFLAYCATVSLPAERYWFDPDPPVFADAPEGASPELVAYARVIHADGPISFAAVVRVVGEGVPACSGSDGPFPYHKDSGPVTGKDLDWWTAHAPECLALPPDEYWVRTTWTIHRPMEAFLPTVLDPLLGWVLPPKHVTEDSPPFTIYPLRRRSSHD